jgi:hypothetical protein
MSNEAASEASRALLKARWGNQKVVRIAREVAERATELPADVRQKLREALENADQLGGDAA